MRRPTHATHMHGGDPLVDVPLTPGQRAAREARLAAAARQAADLDAHSREAAAQRQAEVALGVTVPDDVVRRVRQRLVEHPLRGCETCESPRTPPTELYTSLMRHTRLSRCTACGALWEETEHAAHVLTADEVAALYPELDRPALARPASRRPRARRRLALGLAAVVVVAVGLATRRDGLVWDLVGSALYAALVHVLLALVAPRARSALVGLVAFAVCVVVELAQLTPVPAALAAAFPPAALVLGTTFAAQDLPAYAVGAALAATADHVLRRRARRR